MDSLPDSNSSNLVHHQSDRHSAVLTAGNWQGHGNKPSTVQACDSRQSRWLIGTGALSVALVTLSTLYMVITSMLPIRRDYFEWTSSKSKDTFHLLFLLHFGTTLYILILALLADYYPRLARVLDRLFGRTQVVTTCLVALVGTLILTALHIPGLWWTWTTLGVHVATLLLVYIFLVGRVPNHVALLSGVAVVGIAVGSWEIPYQIGRILIYESAYLTTQEQISRVLGEVIFEFPLILCGILTLKFYNKKYRIAELNSTFLILLAATIALYSFWFASGFWIEIKWIKEGDKLIWVQNPPDYVSKTIYRMSKATLGLALAGMFTQEGIITWIKSQIKQVRRTAE